jgi:hypothetical protein
MEFIKPRKAVLKLTPTARKVKSPILNNVTIEIMLHTMPNNP